MVEHEGQTLVRCWEIAEIRRGRSVESTEDVVRVEEMLQLVICCKTMVETEGLCLGLAESNLVFKLCIFSSFYSLIYLLLDIIIHLFLYLHVLIVIKFILNFFISI